MNLQSDSGSSVPIERTSPINNRGSCWYVAFFNNKHHIFYTWDECSLATKGISGAKYKKVTSDHEKKSFFATYPIIKTTISLAEQPFEIGADRSSAVLYGNDDHAREKIMNLQSNSGSSVPIERTSPINNRGSCWYVAFFNNKHHSFYTWDECSRATKNVSGAKYKKVTSEQEEKSFFTSCAIITSKYSLPEQSCESEAEKSDQFQFNTDELSQNIVTISIDQLTVIDKVKSGSSVFVTGAAGTGKSFLINMLRQLFENKHYSDFEMAFLAPTACAALNISGRTIHSWAGLRPSDDSRPVFENNKRVLSKHARKRWNKARVLVCDEVNFSNYSHG
jgi:hypothetical protein